MAYQKAILSTLMLYKWDNSIFDGFRIPEGVSRETCLNHILMETAEMSVIYTSPDSLKMAITNWTNKNYRVWEELWETLNYDYNPIHNYDRKENSVDKHTGTEINNNERNHNEDLHSSTNVMIDEESSTTEKIAAYNNGMADSNSSNGTRNATNSDSTTQKNERSENEDLNYERDLKDEHFLHAYGNIGVTSTQQMIKEQREIVQFNLFDYIRDDYIRHMCVAVS